MKRLIKNLDKMGKDNFSRDFVKQIIDTMPEIIFYKNKDLQYVMVNKECEKFFNVRGIYNILGKNDLDFEGNEVFAKICRFNDELIVESKMSMCTEERIRIPNTDKYEIYKIVKTPIIDDDGEVIGIIGCGTNITRYKDIVSELKVLSYTDKLTGAYNRTYFEEKIKEIKDKEDYTVGVIVGDINGLKLVNDIFGHIEGDNFIKIIADVIKNICKHRGLVFRWGGDEFIILLEESTKEECKKLIDDINKECQKNKYDNINISISQGYAIFNKENDIESAIKEAEAKLYREKLLNGTSIRKSMLKRLKDNMIDKKIETKEHVKRLIKTCEAVGNSMGLKEEIMEKLLLTAELHDIGKIAIPEKLLLKKSKLTRDEYDLVKSHSEIGYRLANTLPEISYVSREILTHHERWDGKGYPLGLKGEEIPIVSRIINVVDAFDVMTNNKIYNKSITKDQAIEELKDKAGTQFDPEIVWAFSNVIDKV